ncbi:hypothetical protein EBR43_13405 [bacterium]|nr:hypothetical protein [bacterium]
MRQIKLFKQNLGAHWVIGIKGSKDRIEQFHNRVYNWGGTNGELKWMADDFAYFWITMEKLERVMFKYVMNGITDKLGEKFRGSKGGLKAVVMNRVKNTINKIPSEFFVRTAQVEPTYCLGQVSAEKLDTDS